MGVRAISLFSGIGGLDLGVKLACPDARTVCYVEQEPFCQRIIQCRVRNGLLDDAPIWDDVTTFDGTPWRGSVDIIFGGFPCTDISSAGKRRGIFGPESSLWFEFARIVRDVRPRLVFVENADDLVNRGLAEVLGSLAEMGFDAEWGCFKASEVGAPHIRDRCFVLADAGCERMGRRQHATGAGGEAASACVGCEAVGNAHGLGCGARRAESEFLEWGTGAVGTGGTVLADADDGRFRTGEPGLWIRRGKSDTARRGVDLANTAHDRCEGGACVEAGDDGTDARGYADRIFPPGRFDYDGWSAYLKRYPNCAPAVDAQSKIRRGVDGVAAWMDRIHAIGNAVVPLQAATAFVVLARRLGVMEADG